MTVNPSDREMGKKMADSLKQQKYMRIFAKLVTDAFGYALVK